MPSGFAFCWCLNPAFPTSSVCDSEVSWQPEMKWELPLASNFFGCRLASSAHQLAPHWETGSERPEPTESCEQDQGRKRTKEGSMKVAILSGVFWSLGQPGISLTADGFLHTQIWNRAIHLSTTSPWNAKFHRFSMIWGLAASIYTREEKQQAVTWYSLTQLTWLTPTVYASIFVVVLARLCSLFPSNRFHIHFPSSWFLPHLVALSQGQPFQDPWCHWCRSGSQGVAGINRVVRTVRCFRGNLPAS